MVLRHLDVFQCFQETSRETGFWHRNQIYHALSCNRAIFTCCISCPTTRTLSLRRQSWELQLILSSEQQSQCPPVATPRSMTNGLTLTGVEHRSTWAHQIPHLPASMMTWQMMFDFVTQDESSSTNIAFGALFRLKRDRWIDETQAQQSKRT